MEITFISDTHTKHNQITDDLPGGPILVHCGDISYRGSLSEVKDFLDWFEDLPYAHKIMIAGNHDFFFDYSRISRTQFGEIRHGKPKHTKEDVDKLLKGYSIHYLNDSGVEVEGIRFWGSPITPWFHDWAFNRWENEINEHWKLIPDKTDILITHGPPKGILDRVIRDNEDVGCYHLLQRIKDINPKIHTFGHIHETSGILVDGETQFVNASCLDIRYEYRNKPKVIKYKN